MLRLALVSALVSSALIVVISIAMITSTAHTPVDFGFISAVVWIPLTAVATGSVLALRAVDGVSRLGTEQTR